jgi:hypothetical protein
MIIMDGKNVKVLTNLKFKKGFLFLTIQNFYLMELVYFVNKLIELYII